VGISSTTLTTSASATSSATSCDGAMLNDSSRVFEGAMSDDATGAVTGAVLVLAARASSGGVDGALVGSGVGDTVPLISGMAGSRKHRLRWALHRGPLWLAWREGLRLSDSTYPDPANSRGLVLWVCLFEFSGK